MKCENSENGMALSQRSKEGALFCIIEHVPEKKEEATDSTMNDMMIIWPFRGCLTDKGHLCLRVKIDFEACVFKLGSN